MGGNLQTLLLADGQLPAACVHHFGRALAAALHFVHSRGLLHCDLRPANVLLDEDGNVKLAGFGLARRLEQGRGKAAGKVGLLLAGLGSRALTSP